jgi:hypothetical protein
MKKNKSIYKLLGYGVRIIKNVGKDTPPALQMEIASYVHWHMAYQMWVNHVALRGLVNPDKPVGLIRLLDDDGDPQENVITTVQGFMTKHKVAYLPLWQRIFQKNNGSWRGFYSNDKGCDWYNGHVTKWSGSVAAHPQFHLLKQGVTKDSALALIQKSFTPQALRDAIQATFKDRKVISATQAKMQDVFEDARHYAPWVDITWGVDVLEHLEYKQEAWGRASFLDPSEPEALNFNKEQSFKSLGTTGTNTSMYATAHLVLLGGTAYELQDEDKIDSQESDIFESSEPGSGTEEDIDSYKGPIIENMDIFRSSSTENHYNTGPEGDKADTMEEDSKEAKVADLVHLPAKVTRMALTWSSFPIEVTNTQQNDITQMICRWMDENGNHSLPPDLAKLAARAGIVVSDFAVDGVTTTPQQ